MLFNAFYHSLGKYMHTKKTKKKFHHLMKVYIYIKKSKWTECKKPITFFYRKEYYKPVLKMY